ncbi:hypothetical protein L7F22_054421 [Adiantum nelumboides]|nr:hypothetical protein [Adiantum nelumboides]
MTMTTDPDNMAQLSTFRQALSQSRRPLILAGAGLSAASGIPTFRGAGGLWRSHDAMSLATPQAFRADPARVWAFYHYRREVCLKAKPNGAHDVVARLSGREGAKEQVLIAELFFSSPSSVDGLSIRALEKGEKAPIEMHGSLFRTRCTSCGTERPNFDSPISTGLAGTEDLSKEYRAVPLEDLPRCQEPSCGGLLRPAVVWFGESIPELSRISQHVQRADLVLVLGTSSTVYPAAGFASEIRSRGGKAAVFNLEGTLGSEESDGDSDWIFRGPVEEMLPWALGIKSSSL